MKTTPAVGILRQGERAVKGARVARAARRVGAGQRRSSRLAAAGPGGNVWGGSARGDGRRAGGAEERARTGIVTKSVVRRPHRRGRRRVLCSSRPRPCGRRSAPTAHV